MCVICVYVYRSVAIFQLFLRYDKDLKKVEIFQQSCVFTLHYIMHILFQYQDEMISSSRRNIVERGCYTYTIYIQKMDH